MPVSSRRARCCAGLGFGPGQYVQDGCPEHLADAGHAEKAGDGANVPMFNALPDTQRGRVVGATLLALSPWRWPTADLGR